MKHVIVIGFSLVTALMGVVCYKRLATPFRLLSWYLSFSFLDNVINRIVISIYKNNLIVLHAETLANLVFFSLIYYFLFRNRYVKKLVLVSLFFGTVLFAVNFFVLQPYNRVFPSTMMLFDEIFLVACSLVLFKQMLQYPLQVNITRQSIFWYNTAILFFYSMMFLNYALVNYYYIHNIQSSIEEFSWYFTEIGFNLLLGLAVWLDKKNLKSDNSPELLGLYN